MTKDRRVLCLFLFKNVKKTVVYPEEHMIILIGLIILINGNITKIAEDGKTYGRVIIMIMTGNNVLCAK